MNTELSIVLPTSEKIAGGFSGISHSQFGFRKEKRSSGGKKRDAEVSQLYPA